MPGFRSRSQNALPVWQADDDGNPIGVGTQPAASSQSVTPASDSAPFPVAVRATRSGAISASVANFTGQLQAPGDPNSYVLEILQRYYSGTGNNTIAATGDITGGWMHNPPSTVSSALSGSIATSGTTAAIVMTNVTRTEVMNPSTAPLWASWGTPAVNGAGSFAIAAGGSYNVPDRAAGTLTLLSTAATQPYTINRFT